MPHRKHYLLVCTNRRPDDHPKGSCAVAGSEALLQELKEALLRRGLAHEARACGTTCLDLCEHGPSVVVEPEHIVYGHVQAGDVEELIDALAEGGVVERLVITREGASRKEAS